MVPGWSMGEDVTMRSAPPVALGPYRAESGPRRSSTRSTSNSADEMDSNALIRDEGIWAMRSSSSRRGPPVNTPLNPRTAALRPSIPIHAMATPGSPSTRSAWVNAPQSPAAPEPTTDAAVVPALTRSRRVRSGDVISGSWSAARGVSRMTHGASFGGARIPSRRRVSYPSPAMVRAYWPAPRERRKRPEASVRVPGPCLAPGRSTRTVPPTTGAPDSPSTTRPASTTSWAATRTGVSSHRSRSAVTAPTKTARPGESGRAVRPTTMRLRIRRGRTSRARS